MRRIVIRSSRGEARDLAPHVRAGLGVEPGGRLVEEEPRRVVDQPHRDVESSLHPARVGLRRPAGRGGQLEPLEQLGDPSPQRVGPAGRRSRPEARGSRGRSPPGRNHASARRRRSSGGRGPGVRARRARRRRPARVGRGQRRQDPDRRRLAGAVRPEQREDRPFLDLEVEPVERLHVGRIALAKARGLDRDRHGRDLARSPERDGVVRHVVSGVGIRLGRGGRGGHRLRPRAASPAPRTGSGSSSAPRGSRGRRRSSRRRCSRSRARGTAGRASRIPAGSRTVRTRSSAVWLPRFWTPARKSIVPPTPGVRRVLLDAGDEVDEAGRPARVDGARRCGRARPRGRRRSSRRRAPPTAARAVARRRRRRSADHAATVKAAQHGAVKSR